MLEAIYDVCFLKTKMQAGLLAILLSVCLVTSFSWVGGLVAWEAVLNPSSIGIYKMCFLEILSL